MSDFQDKQGKGANRGNARESDVVKTHDEIIFVETKGSMSSFDYISYFEAFKMIVYNSIPSIIGLVFQILVEVMNLIFVGQTGDAVALGAVGLGNMLFNVVCFSIGMGLNGAIDTLCSQAYGKKQYYLCGCYLNRGRILQALFFIPELIIFLFTKELLLLLGQDIATAESSRLYIYTLLPGMFAMTQFETVRRYLQAMKIFYVTMYIQAATMVLHCVWSYLFVFTFDLGVSGASIATCITYWSNLIFITLYVTYKTGLVEPASWHLPNKDSFIGWWEYLKFGVPAALMLCLEWWSFEIMAIFAGMLSIDELAANVVMFNLIAFLFQFAFGMSFAVSNLVGNSLGQDKPVKAKRYFVTSLMTIVGMTVILMILLVSLRWYVPYIYTQQIEVVTLCAETIPVFIIMIFFDYFQSVASGSVRAIGYQKYGSIVALIGYWCFSIPGAYLFAFVADFRLVGIWLGAPLGTFIASVSYATILFCADWKQASIEITQRMKRVTKFCLNSPTHLNFLKSN